jgi:hypothetical protein
MTASMFHETNLTPGSDNQTLVDDSQYDSQYVHETNLTPGSEQPYQRNPVMSTAPNVHAALREGGLSSELGKLLERWGWYALTPPDP